MQKQRIDTVQFKTAGRLLQKQSVQQDISHSRYIAAAVHIKKKSFYDTLSAIGSWMYDWNSNLSMDLDTVIIAQKLVIGILCPFSDKLREVMAHGSIFQFMVQGLD